MADLSELRPRTAIHGDAVAGVKKTARASQVKKQIDLLKTSSLETSLDLAELLSEARTNVYFKEWGYETLKDYLEAETEYKERQCYYLIRIVDNAKELGINRPALVKTDSISKLKHIFSLDPEQFAADIKRLVKLAATEPLDAIIAAVKALKREAGEPEMTWLNFSVTREAKDNVILPALETAQLEAGSSVNDKGEESQVSPGRALEFICAEWQQDPNRAASRMEHDVDNDVEA